MSVQVGDLVEYAPFTRTRTHGYGFGIVLRVADPGVQPNGSRDSMAEVLWAKWPGDGPQWYQAKNLLVASSPEEV